MKHLEKSLGDDLVPALRELFKVAPSTRHRELYIALMAALKNPQLEGLLHSIASNPGRSARGRGLALYALGLIGTESAWESAKDAWAKIGSKRSPGMYWGLGLFGDVALPTLLKEAERLAKTRKSGWADGALSVLRPGQDKSELKKLFEQHPSSVVRKGVLRALLHQPDEETLGYLFDALSQPRDEATRNMLVAALGDVLRIREINLEANEKLFGLLRSQMSSYPVKLQLALYSYPELRAHLPEDLLDHMPSSNSSESLFFVWALASDETGHSRLADLVKQGGGFVLIDTYSALDEYGAFDNEQLASTLSGIALDPSQEPGSRDFAWRTLAFDKGGARVQAITRAPDVYYNLENDLDRMSFVGSLQHAGTDAVPVLVELLKAEQSPLVRLELISTILSISGTLLDSETIRAMEPLISNELSNLQSPSGQLWMQYAITNPRGWADGVNISARLVRNLYAAYGTPDQIPEIQNFGSSFQVPEHLAQEHQIPATALQQLAAGGLQAVFHRAVVESIEVIRVRYGF